MYCFNVTPGGAFKDAEYKLAQSGDATCNGLESAEVCLSLENLPFFWSLDFFFVILLTRVYFG